MTSSPLRSQFRALALGLLLAACGPEAVDPEGIDETSSHPVDDSSGGVSTVGSISTSGNSPTTDDKPTSSAGTSGASTTEATTLEPTTGDPTTTDDSTEGAHVGRLVGFAGTRGVPGLKVTALDPATLELTVLADVPPMTGNFMQGCGAYDPNTDRIFQINADDIRLVVVDGSTGALLGETPIVSDNPAGIGNLEINNAGELVGLTIEFITHVVRINVDTGVVTTLAELELGNGELALGSGAFDPATNRMFQVLSDDRLLVLDAATGAMIDDPPLMMDIVDSIYDLAVNNAGELVGVRVGAEMDLVRIDPLTGLVTELTTLAGLSPYVSGQIVHDPVTDHLFLKNINEQFFVVDAGTGELLSSKPIVSGVVAGFSFPVFVP